MFIKKVLTIDRKTGELLSERYEKEANISEERFWKPLVDLYKEELDKFAKNMKGESK